MGYIIQFPGGLLFRGLDYDDEVGAYLPTWSTTQVKVFETREAAEGVRDELMARPDNGLERIEQLIVKPFDGQGTPVTQG